MISLKYFQDVIFFHTFNLLNLECSLMSMSMAYAQVFTLFYK